MSENNVELIDSIIAKKSLIKEKNKDIIISSLNSKLQNLSKEINRLKKENSDLKTKYSYCHNVQVLLKEAEETIKNLNEKNLNLILEHKNKEVEFQNKINEILLKIENDKLNREKQEILSTQKIQNAKQIELENEMYKKEIIKLKKQIETIDCNSKSKINELQVNNLIKFNSLKKKILSNLTETKLKLDNLNFNYLDNNNRINILRNYQLLKELEVQKSENDQLIKQNSELSKQISEIKDDLDIHQKVEIQLAEKIKKHRIKSNLDNNKKLIKSFSTTSIFNKNKGNKNIDNEMKLIYQKLKRIKNMNESWKSRFTNKKNRNILSSKYHMNKTQIDYMIPQTKNLFLKERDIFNNNKNFRDYSDISVNSRLISDDNFFNKDISLIPDENILNKFKNLSNEKKYINLYNYLEKCLDNFYEDIKNNLKGKNKIKIDFENIKKLKFNEFSLKDQYILLILLMNHILPLIYVYFNSNSNNIINDNNLFKTDLNLNYKILNKIYGNPSNIIKRTFLGKDKKLTVELCMNKLGENIKRKNSYISILDKKYKI